MAFEFTDELITYARAIALGVARSGPGRALCFDESEMISIAYCAGVEACARADANAYPKTYFFRWVSGKCLNALRAERRRRRREGCNYISPSTGAYGELHTIRQSGDSYLLAGPSYDTIQIIGRFAASHERRVVVLVLLVVVHGLQPTEITAPSAETQSAMDKLREWLKA